MYVSMEDSKFCEKINKDVEVFDLFQNDFEDLDKSSSDWWREDQASEFSASVSSETNNCNIERVECKSPIFKTPYSEPRTRKQKKSFTSISSNSSSKKRRRVASPESSETSALEMDWYSPYKFSKLSPVVPLQVESGTIPESLEALLEEGSDVSWSSTFATPLASNATLSNLNSNEKKVFIPSNELKKPRVLFSPDKDVDFTECYQLMDTSGDTSQANISDITVLAENSNIYKTVSPVTSKKNMSVSRCSTVTEDLFDTSLSSNNGNVQNSEGNSCVPIVLEQTTVLTSSFERTAEIQIAPVEHSIEGENISDNSTKCSVLCNMSKKNNLSKSCDSGVNESTEISVVDNFSPVRDVTSMSVSVSRKLFGSGKDEKPSEVFAAHNETVPAIEQDSGAVTCDVSDRKFSSTVESIKHPQLISVTSADSLNETASRGHTTQDFPQDLSFSTLEEICQITELLAASTDMPVECSQDERRENKAIKTPVCIKLTTPKCSRLCRTSTPFTRTERHFSVDSGKKKKKIKFVCDTENEHLNSECVEHNEVSNDLRQDGEELGQRLHESDAIKKQNSAEQKFPPKNASDIASRVQSIRDSVNQSKKFSYLSSGMQIAADILENKSSDSVADDVMKSARLFEQALMRTKSNTKKLDLSSNAKQEFIPFCKLKDNCPVTDCSSVPDPEMKTEDINLCTSEKTKRTTAVQNGTDTNISTVCSHFCEEVKTDSMTDSFNISEIESLCNVEEKCTSKLTCEALVPEVFGKELENDFYPKERELESSSLCKSASIQGFKTASGNQIKVSKESICKAMKFMDDIITGEKSHSSVDMTSAHEKNLSFNEQCDKSDFTSKSLITADKSVVPKFIEDHSVSFHEVNDGCLRSSNQIIPMHENNASHWSDNGTLEKNNDQENMVTDSQMILAVEHAEMMQQLVGDETIFSELPEETEGCGNKLFRKKNTSERGDRTEEPAGDKKFWYPPGKCEIVPENMEVSVTQCNIENQLKHLPEQYLQGEKQLYKKDVESSSFVRKEDEFKTCNLMQGADSSAVLECVNNIKPSNEEVDMEALLNSTVIGQLFSDNLHAFKTESTAQEAVLKSKNSLNPDHDMLATSKSEMQIQQPDLSGFYTANKKRSLISDCSPQRANEISEFEAESAYLKNRTSISSEETSENISESDSKIEHEKTAKYSTISEEKNWLLGAAMKLFPGDENSSKKFKNTSANLLTVKGGSNSKVNSVNQYSQLESARLSGNMLPMILEKNEIAEISKNISQNTENSLDHVTVSVVKDLTAADVKKTSTSPKTFKSAQHMISEIDAHVSSGTENLSKIQIQHTESEFTINNSFNGEQSLYLNRGSEFVDGSETADISHANGRKVSVSALNSESKAELLKSKGNNEKINLAFHKHLVRPINRKTVSESATITKECLELMGSKEDLPVFRDFPEKLDSPNLRGFSTASGKKVSVSTKALIRAQKLFAEETQNKKSVSSVTEASELKEMDRSSSTIFKEFSAESDKVSASTKGLSKAKKMFAEENHSMKMVIGTDVTESSVLRGLENPYSPIFKGFSTASGKRVAVSVNAFNRAKKLFLEENFCVTAIGSEAGTSEMKQQQEHSSPVLNGFRTAIGKEGLVPISTLERAKEDLYIKEVGSETSEMKQQHILPNLKGFSTANGKKICVSDKALQRAKELFEEENPFTKPVADLAKPSDLRELGGLCSTIPKEFSTANQNRVSVSVETLNRTKKLLTEENQSTKPVSCAAVSSELKERGSCSPVLQGFSTASGKKVSLSAKALNEVQKLFLGEDSCIKEVGIEAEMRNEHNSPILKGFSTASGKKVPVSAEALSKAKKLFSEEDSCIESVCTEVELSKMRNKHSSPISKRFSTSRKKVSVSAKALSKAKKSLLEEDSCLRTVDETKTTEMKENTEHNSPILKGFSTASGKKVSVSAKALNRVKKLFSDEEYTKTITRIAESSELNKQEGPHSPVLQRFSTASGKKVPVSAKNLSKVKKLFSDEKEYMEPVTNVAESSEKGQERPCSPILQEFSTASGKKVSVSAKALSRVKELFAEENEPSSPVAESSELKEQKRPYSPVLQGFSTASGKKVSVSAKALSRAKELFAEENEPDITVAESSGLKEQERPYSPVLQGFSTASGKKVSVSAKALSRVKELFAEENKYIKPVRNVPESSELKEQEIPCSPVLGFSTASGKKVSVSSQALSRVKKLFAEENDVAESSNLKEQEGLCSPLLQGCSVENGKNVSVATKSLCAAKKLFLEEDCPMKAVDTGVEMLEMKDKNNSLILKGFSTASGKKVSVTENSLVRAKQLFLEDSSIQGIDMESVVPIPQIISTTGTRRVSVNSDKCVTDVKFQKSNEPTSVSKPSENVRSSVVRRKSSTGKLRLSRSEKVSSRSTSALCASYQASENSAVLPVLLSREKMNEHAKEECEHKESKFTSQEQDNLNPTSLSHAAMDIQMRDNTDLRVPKGMNLPMSLTQEVQESAAALLADEAALDSPGWVASYVSCPDMLHDRVAAPSAMVSSEVNDAEAAAVTEPGSPVLGSCERGRKNKRSRLSQKSLGVNLEQKTHTTSSSFKVPYKKTTNTAEKMLSSSHISAPKQTRRHLEFGTPFRKHFPLMEQNGWSVSHEKRERSGREKREVCSEVVTGRQTAADEQEALVRRRTNTGVTDLLPCTGSYYVRKQERHTQMTWREAVNGTLPGRYTRSQLLKFGIKEFVLDISAENSVEFRFSAWDYYSRSVCEDNVKGLLVGDGAHLILDAKGTAGVEEVTRAFLSSPGIEPALVPSGWVRNHYRWLVWKLAAIERSFPQQFSNRCLTPNVLLLQLKYRYDREIDHCERPAIRKILEHDDTAAKRLVLCVARIVKLEKAETDLCFELELTDGWYGLNAVVDQEMCHRIRRGTIAVGTKLISHGAELLNCEQGCSPLEVGSEVKLKLHSNSTRRARWDTKLGFHSKPGPLRIPLTSVLSAGGMISCVSVMVVRVYPTLYVEKLADGRSVIRSLRAEEQAALHWERNRQACVELLFSQVKGELLREDAKKKQQIHRNQIPRAQELSLICSGEKLCNILELAPDPASIEALLNEEQRLIVADYQRLKCEKMQLELQTRVTEKLGETTATVRNVAPLFKVRCVDVSATKPSKSAMLSVWRPSEDVIHMLKEGSTVTLFNVSAAGTRGGDLQLSAGRQTVYRPSSHQNNCIFKRRVTSFGEVTSSDFCPQFGELDVVGMVVFIGDAPQGTSGFQVVYLADVASNILGMAFWGGVKQFGWEELLKPRTVVAASNLQWRHGAAIRWVPCAYVSELSCFSTNPRQPHLQEALTSFTQEIRNKDVHLFSSACEEKVSLLLRSSSLVPGLIPKRSNAQLSADSPHNGSKEEGRNQHSNGLLVPNIRGTVNSCTTVTSHAVNSVTDPSTKAASSSLERRIQKLQQYGEPPPLSPLILAPLRPSVKKEFHTPVKKESPVDADNSPPLSLDSDPG